MMQLDQLRQWCESFQRKTVESYIQHFMLDDHAFEVKYSLSAISRMILINIVFGALTWLSMGDAYNMNQISALSFSLLIVTGLLLCGSGLIISGWLQQCRMRQGRKDELRALSLQGFMEAFGVNKSQLEQFHMLMHRQDVKNKLSVYGMLQLTEDDLKQVASLMSDDQWDRFSAYAQQKKNCQIDDVFHFITGEQNRLNYQQELAKELKDNEGQEQKLDEQNEPKIDWSQLKVRPVAVGDNQGPLTTDPQVLVEEKEGMKFESQAHLEEAEGHEWSDMKSQQWQINRLAEVVLKNSSETNLNEK